MQGDTRKRRAHPRSLRQGSKASAKVIPMLDRCEDSMPTVWGPWHLINDGQFLVCDLPGCFSGQQYEIDLKRAKLASQKCDWLAQLAEKTWANREVLGGLVQALDATVGLRPGPGERGI